MSTRSVVPFGPQHPVLPEPIHLDLVLEDEKVVEAIPSIGFIHRGLEKLVEIKDFNQYVFVAERICGICSFMHGMGYCEAVEHVMNVEIPDRAKFLRTVGCELSRLHSHLLWLGLLADAFGFESLFMESWKIREKILDMVEASSGGRLISSINTVGGFRKDVDNDLLKSFVPTLLDLKKQVEEIATTFLENKAVISRLSGVGYLSAAQAEDLGACGPFLRASGIDRDMRYTGYAAYPQIEFESITSNVGDCFARCDVRIREIYQSIDIIRQAIEKIPDGPTATPVKGFPSGEYFMRLEQPRGEAIYYVKANGTKFLDRVRVRTPTFANIPAMAEMLKGCQLADVPMMVLTIDPCISCTER